MTSFKSCYTPTQRAVEAEHDFGVKELISPFSNALRNISIPRAFKSTKAPSGKVVSTRDGEVTKRKTGNPLTRIQNSGQQ